MYYFNQNATRGKKVECCSKRLLSVECMRSFRLPRAPSYFPLIGDKAPPAACDSNKVARAYNERYYPHTGNGGHSWCLISNLSLSEGFSIQDEAMDVARSASQGPHYHADVICLLH